MKVLCVFILVFCTSWMLEASGRVDVLPPLSSGHGWHADALELANDGYQIIFHPAEWPNVRWATDSSWNWGDNASLLVTLENPGKRAIEVGIRVDDNPAADGNVHCSTTQVTIEPQTTMSWGFPLDQKDAVQVFGMKGLPVSELPNRFSFARGQGTVNTHHITAFQIFTHNPVQDSTVIVHRLTLVSGAPDDDKNLVDIWGQSTRSDWPGKVHRDDWVARVAQETADLSDHPAPADRDKWGGWASGPAQNATGYFRTAQVDGRWWLVTPSGHLFLSWGVDSVRAADPTLVGPRQGMFPALPQPGQPEGDQWGKSEHVLYGPVKSGTTYDFYQANLERKWGQAYRQVWPKLALQRLPSWGFNTVGNWSDPAVASPNQPTPRLPYVATWDVWGNFARVASGTDHWGKMPDPFDPQFAQACRDRFRTEAARLGDDPWCVGIFVDNELSWTGKAGVNADIGLALGTLASEASQPAKQALIDFLKATYASVSALDQAWGTKWTNWNDLKAQITLSGELGSNLRADLEHFVSLYARQYFRVVSAALREFDAHHLYLGCRFSGTPPRLVVPEAAHFCDVVSFNIYQHTLDPSDWNFTTTLGKPCLVGEFHFGALDRGLFHPGLVPVADQAARATAFGAYVRSVADLPAFVGAHWFEYVDEPTTGRPLDGENYQIGLVSVTDTPYTETIDAAREVLPTLYQRHAASKLN